MYGKLIDGELQIAPRKLPGDGVVVYNPPAEMYLAAGYKPVEYIDAPEAPEGYTYESSWSEIDSTITQIWTLIKLPDDIDDSEAIEILLGGIK